ncbi:hypothetical protein [Paenibacillus dendritiformis]|uniref:hypothetical protein n=1 Tax=Paenibacillus dendritiformis TaxID=130049 RepID=UPI0018CD8374|nr:hypothetical protein [Paenibacillus dendritiformis]
MLQEEGWAGRNPQEWGETSGLAAAIEPGRCDAGSRSGSAQSAGQFAVEQSSRVCQEPASCLPSHHGGDKDDRTG